jgi:hypothetical protein
MDPARLLLELQCVLFGAVLWRELRVSDRNIYACIFVICNLVLIQAQGFYIMSELDDHERTYVTHLFQEVTYTGALSACWLLTVYCFAAVSFYFLTSRRRLEPRVKRGVSLVLRPTRLTYVFVFVLMAVCAEYLAVLYGGWREFVTRPGQIIHGQTAAIMFLGLGAFPLLARLIANTRPTIMDYGLVGFAFTVTLLNSRILAILMMAGVILARHYHGQPLKARGILFSFGLWLCIMFVYGTYRDSSNYFAKPTVRTLIDYTAARLSQGTATLRWYYATNVEGFTGLAGLVTAEQSAGPRRDYGLVTLGFPLTLVPYSIRSSKALPLWRLDEFIRDAGVSRSVVSPGVELAYLHFGVFGMLLFGAASGWLMRAAHARLRSGGSGLLAVWFCAGSLMLVRGTFAHAAIYCTMACVNYYVFRSISKLVKVAGGQFISDYDSQSARVQVRA